MQMITPTDYEKSEWKRFAASLRKENEIRAADEYDKYANCDEMPLNHFDTMQRHYRKWLVFNELPKGQV